ncbi:MAG: radical SAM protein [Bacteroidales bacterium]
MKLKSISFFPIVKVTHALSLFVMVNNSCNLNCSYCFEHEKNNSYFNENKINLFIDEIKKLIKRFNYNYLNITYTGGEPLMYFNAIIQLTDKLKTICDNNIKIDFFIITNGTLINNLMLEFIEKNNISLQITLDGNRDIHDSFRYYKNHKGTFDDIVAKLEVIKAGHNIPVNIRINISQESFSIYEDLLSFLYNKFPNYKIYIDFVDVEKTSPLYLTNKQKIVFFDEYLSHGKKFNRKDFVNYIEGGYCMARNQDSFTIDSNFRFYRCYSFVQSNVFSYNDLETMLKSHKENPLICNKCDCEVYNFCNGGCIYKNYVANSKLGIKCNKELIKTFNNLIFMHELNQKCDIKLNIEDFNEKVKYCNFDI